MKGSRVALAQTAAARDCLVLSPFTALAHKSLGVHTSPCHNAIAPYGEQDAIGALRNNRYSVPYAIPSLRSLRLSERSERMEKSH